MIQVTRHYDSLQAFAHDARTAPVQYEPNRYDREGALSGSLTGHAGGRPLSAEEFLALVNSGWTEGVTRMREAMGELPAPAVREVRRKARWSDQGDELDRDRLMAGQLDTAWRRVSRQVLHRIVPVRIIVACGARSYVRAESMFWRGAAGVALADALALAGYPVQVVASLSAVGGGRWRHDVGVVAKDFNGPLNLGALVAATAHQSFLRSLGWAHRAAFVPAHVAGMGSSCDPTVQGLGFGSEAKNLIVPWQTLSAEAAKAWVSEQVKLLEEEGTP